MKKLVVIPGLLAVGLFTASSAFAVNEGDHHHSKSSTTVKVTIVNGSLDGNFNLGSGNGNGDGSILSSTSVTTQNNISR